MPTEKQLRLMRLYDWAHRDMEYLALDMDFRETQEAFALFLQGLTEAEREVVELFLMRYAARSHRLLDLALTMPNNG